MSVLNIFKDNNNKDWSYSRIMCAILVTASIVWCSYTVFTNKTIPDLLGVTGLVTALYGVGRVSEALETKSITDAKSAVDVAVVAATAPNGKI